jgi:hypothetical protein
LRFRLLSRNENRKAKREGVSMNATFVLDGWRFDIEILDLMA